MSTFQGNGIRARLDKLQKSYTKNLATLSRLSLSLLLRLQAKGGGEEGFLGGGGYLHFECFSLASSSSTFPLGKKGGGGRGGLAALFLARGQRRNPRENPSSRGANPIDSSEYVSSTPCSESGSVKKNNK